MPAQEQWKQQRRQNSKRKSKSAMTKARCSLFTLPFAIARAPLFAAPHALHCSTAVAHACARRHTQKPLRLPISKQLTVRHDRNFEIRCMRELRAIATSPAASAATARTPRASSVDIDGDRTRAQEQSGPRAQFICCNETPKSLRALGAAVGRAAVLKKALIPTAGASGL